MADDVLATLEKIFQTTNEWLRYAEAKNAVLFAFSGAGMTATITYLSAANSIPKSLQLGMCLTTSILCLTALICAVSFLPRTALEYILWRKSNPSRKRRVSLSQEDNLYHFAHLQKYTKHELMTALNNMYFEGKIQNLHKKQYLDLSNQIVVNAEIASMKFYLSKWAVYSLIASILATPVSLILSMLIHRSI